MRQRLVIRHATRDEVLTQGGFYSRERQTASGPVKDDVGAMEFTSEADARSWLVYLGIADAGHQIVQREEKGKIEEGGVGQVKIEEFYGL